MQHTPVILNHLRKRLHRALAGEDHTAVLLAPRTGLLCAIAIAIAIVGYGCGICVEGAGCEELADGS